jgi:hypothetical protein
MQESVELDLFIHVPADAVLVDVDQKCAAIERVLSRSSSSIARSGTSDQRTIRATARIDEENISAIVRVIDERPFKDIRTSYLMGEPIISVSGSFLFSLYGLTISGVKHFLNRRFASKDLNCRYADDRSSFIITFTKVPFITIVEILVHAKELRRVVEYDLSHPTPVGVVKH